MENLNKHITVSELGSFVVDNSSFKFSDYHCIGFDLEMIISNIDSEMYYCHYKYLAKYLIKQKNFDSTYLLKPIEKSDDLLFCGRWIDIKNGNVICLNNELHILHGYHGTKKLNEDEILKIYGTHKMNSNNTHSFFNCEIPAALLFARAVDYIDHKNEAKIDAPVPLESSTCRIVDQIKKTVFMVKTPEEAPVLYSEVLQQEIVPLNKNVEELTPDVIEGSEEYDKVPHAIELKQQLPENVVFPPFQYGMPNPLKNEEPEDRHDIKRLCTEDNSFFSTLEQLMKAQNDDKQFGQMEQFPEDKENSIVKPTGMELHGLLGVSPKYDVYYDIREAIFEMNALIKSGQFPPLPETPYNIQKVNQNILKWLIELKKQNIILFITTKLNIDFAGYILRQSLGLVGSIFDLLIVSFDKNEFMHMNNPFKSVDCVFCTTEPHIPPKSIKRANAYKNGNFRTFYKFVQELVGTEPKMVYIGENVLTDINETPIFKPIVRNSQKLSLESLEYLARKPVDYEYVQVYQ